MDQLRPGVAKIGALLLAAFFLGPLSAPAVHAQEAQLTAPPPGKALLYIFRSDRQPSEALVPVSVNADIAGYLENDTFITVPVNPGRTFLRSGDRVLATMAFEAEADRSYYVRVRAVHGVTVVQTEIDLVDEPRGRGALAQSRFMPSAAPAAPAPSPQTPAASGPQTAEPGAAPAADTDAGESRMYIRVDVGLSKSVGTDLKDENFLPGVGAICGDAACTTAGKLKDVGPGLVLSGGFGYRFASHARGDVTLSFRAYHLNQTDGSGNNFQAPIASVSVMANGYIDFASSGVSPYLGVGVGLARNTIGNIDSDQGQLEGGSSNNAATALMAGIGFPVSKLVLDFGYRFTNLGKLKVPADGVTGYQGASGTLKAHELTLGFRF